MKNFALRIIRFAGAIVLIYVSMVFYLALTERQIAFPRAITHKEANQAIQGKVQSLSCTLEDGVLLQGWQLGKTDDPTLLYYPDTDEDAAQFLAEVGQLENLTLVAFNYRGSGNNKGTPSSETFEGDGKQIAECTAQLNGQKPAYIAGRGVGAILASEQAGAQKIFIDPVYSIADKINEKYRLLYPKFIIRTNIQMSKDISHIVPNGIIIIQDRKSQEAATSKVLRSISADTLIQTEGAPLKEKIQQAIKNFADKRN